MEDCVYVFEIESENSVLVALKTNETCPFLENNQKVFIDTHKIILYVQLSLYTCMHATNISLTQSYRLAKCHARNHDYSFIIFTMRAILALYFQQSPVTRCRRIPLSPRMRKSLFKRINDQQGHICSKEITIKLRWLLEYLISALTVDEYMQWKMEVCALPTLGM